MKKAIGITLLLFAAALIITQPAILDSVLLFLVTGRIVGTSIAIPFWAMIAIYCILIAVIATRTIESLFSYHTIEPTAKTTPRMPRRRYSNL